MSAILPDKEIDIALSKYFSNLSISQLCDLVPCLSNIQNSKDLPDDLLSALYRKKYKFPTLLYKCVADRLVSFLCFKIIDNKVFQKSEEAALRSYMNYQINLMTSYEKLFIENPTMLSSSQKEAYASNRNALFVSEEILRETSPILLEYGQYMLKILKSKTFVSVKTYSVIHGGKHVIIVQQPILVMSQCLPGKWLKKNFKPDEVHFVACQVIYIDCDLHNSVWHGINVVLMAKRIECIPPPNKEKIVWDLSGLTGVCNTFIVAGEDGGNVLLLANTFVTMKLLTIQSNGGNGLDGTMGNDGDDGTNGSNGTDAEHCGIFSANIIPISTEEELVRHKIMQIALAWDRNPIQHSKNIEKLLKNWKSFSIEGVSQDGHKFEIHSGVTRGYKCVLGLVKGTLGIKGSKGKPGKPGEPGGAAGNAGILLQQKIDSNDIEPFEDNAPLYMGKPGNDGRRGKNGAEGKFGRSGKDGTDYCFTLHSNQGLHLGKPGKYKIIRSNEFSKLACLSEKGDYVSVVYDNNIQEESGLSNQPLPPENTGALTGTCPNRKTTKTILPDIVWITSIHAEYVNECIFAEYLEKIDKDWWLEKMFKNAFSSRR